MKRLTSRGVLAAVLAHAGSSVQFQARARVTAEDGATRVDGSQRSFKDVTGNQVTVRGTPALGTGARTSLSLVTLVARR